MSDDNEEERIAYGRPPVHSRFKPGSSGNAKGRPKKSRNIATEIPFDDKGTGKIKIKPNTRAGQQVAAGAAFYSLELCKREKAKEDQRSTTAC
jgi:hypothetical protein